MFVKVSSVNMNFMSADVKQNIQKLVMQVYMRNLCYLENSFSEINITITLFYYSVAKLSYKYKTP